MAVPAYIDGQTQDSAGATTITFDMSTITHQAGDFLLACVKQSENTAQQTWDDDGGGGNGWIQIAYNRTTGGRDQETAIYYKFADSSTESDPTFDWDSGGTNEPMSGILLVYRGVDTVNPFQGPTWQWATNDGNPPNPEVQVLFENTRVVCFHAATHDDISSVAAPTGFTIRDYVYGGSAQHTNDHRDLFSADIEVDTIGNYAPPDWQHGVANTTPEYQTYSIALNELQPIHITAPDDNSPYLFTTTNIVIEGDGFEASQGSGGVELWDSNIDSTSTTKVSQSIDSWDATSIQFDVVQGSHSDGILYLVVTNDSADESRKVPLLFGFVDYEPWQTEEPDHYWSMNNVYTDHAARDGVDRPFNAVQTGTPDFVTSPLLTRNTTHSFRINQAVESSEVADSVFTNVTNTHSARNIGGWVHFVDNQNTPGTFMEEGGGVNNYYFIMEPNGRVVINIADEGDYKAQRSSDFQFKTGRTYHVMLSSDQNDTPKVFDLWVDGEKSTSPLAGSLGTKADMVAHSGDWTFGDADANLDTGGVDIAYAAAYTMYYSHWGTWSNTGGGAPLTDDQIRNNLFRAGALAEHTIDSDTESNMQADIDDYDSQTHDDLPLTYDIEDVTGGGNLELTIVDQVWPDEVKFQIRWRGGNQLTIRNSGTSNCVASKCWSPVGGTISIIETAGVAINVKDIDDNSNIQNARVLLEADTGGPLPVGASVSITRSASTATVTHTSHGLVTGSKVKIEGANQDEYNGIQTITVTGANSYTYTVSGTPTTPATGTILSTAVIIDGDTDASGNISGEIDFTSNQPVTGIVRKGSTSTFYQEGNISSIITSAGLSLTIFMVRDE